MSCSGEETLGIFQYYVLGFVALKLLRDRQRLFLAEAAYNFFRRLDRGHGFWGYLFATVFGIALFFVSLSVWPLWLPAELAAVAWAKARRRQREKRRLSEMAEYLEGRREAPP